MAKSKDTKKLTDEELLAQFDTIGADDAVEDPATKESKQAPAHVDDDDEENPFAELNKTLKAQPRSSATISRPDTPQASSTSAAAAQASSAATSTTGRGGKPTPPSSGRNSSEEGGQPAEDPAAADAAPAGSWWGGFSAIVSGARKQAEAAYKEIQRSEDAAKWAEQVREGAGAYSATLRGLGAAVGSRALPTFTSLLHTIAPPISQHERLQIHTTHDLSHYPTLDPLIYATFSRVMAQVEGGDLIVLQRGSEARPAPEGTLSGFSGGASSSGSWSDGPWWRDSDFGASVSPQRNVGSVKGLVEGTKLARASAESFAHEFFATKGGVEEAAKNATAELDTENPVRSSDIFLAIQAISHGETPGLFQASATAAAAEGEKKKEDEVRKDAVSFAIFLFDPIHSIAYSTVSQPVPQKWIDWLDAAPPAEASQDQPRFPTEIEEIVAAGGVDPREWVAEWLEEVIALAVGVVAQRYVARRMGVGENGAALKGRRKVAEVMESGGGEAARAI